MKNPIIVEAGKRKQPLDVYDASVTLSIVPLSTATLTLPAGTTFPSRTYVEMFTEQGSAGVYRTRSPRIGIGNSTQVDLEHAIADLGDYLIAESYEKEMTLTDAVKEVFKFYKGSNWKLGTVEKGSTKVVLDTEYDTVLDAILALMEQEPSLMMTFNFSGFPWVVNIIAKPTAISAEGRLSRNVKSATITTDDTDLCTRVYMEELPGTKDNVYGHLDATTIGKYGVIEKEISGSNYTEEQAKRAAQLYLDKHKEPSITIQIDAIDLSQITGESLDTFQIGKKMRLALPDYGIIKEETITQIAWSSIFGNPNSVTITLAEEEDTVLLAVNTQAKVAQKSATRTKKKVKKSIEYVVDENGNITPKSIADAMNEDKETRIDGKRIYIGDKDSVTVINGKCSLKDVTAEYISAKIAGLKILNAHQIHADDYLISNTTGMGQISLKSAFTNAQIKRSGNTYTLQMIRASNPSKWEDHGTFSRAVTALNGAWSGGVYSVTPTPQGSPTHKITLRDQLTGADAWIDITTTGTPTVMSTNEKWIEATMRFVSRNASGTPTNRGDAFTMGFNATAVYNKVTVDSIGLAENYSPLDDASTRSNIYIQADASNGKKKDDKLLQLASTTYNNGQYCVNLTDGSSVIGRISVQNRYTAGRNATKVSDPTWSSTPSSNPSSNSNTATFTTDAPSPASGASKSLKITLDRDSGWNDGSRYVYAIHTDSAAAHRIAKIEVTIPSTTVKREIYTYGNTFPTSINGGTISKSGITAGKYMVCIITCGDKDVNIRFKVTA